MFILQLSLFFDILLCLTTDITKEDYIAGTFKQPQAISSGVISTESQSPGESVMRRARAKLWKNLREADLKMKAGEKREGERQRREEERGGGREGRGGGRGRERGSEREGGREREREREFIISFAVPLPGVEHHYMRLVAVDVLSRYQPQEVRLTSGYVL